jgi:predicted aconitase
MRLSDADKRMLDGARGEAARLAMSVIVRMAAVCDARELMDITGAHIDGCGLLSDAGLEFAETLASRGGRVAVPTTLNMGPLDLRNWRAFGVPEDFAAKAIRQARAYEGMGCVPTWTCAPYQGYLAPRFGQQVAWGESNAVIYANSVLGARTNRYGDYLDICAALTGRVPRCGLHLAENRRGRILLRLVGVPPAVRTSEAFYPALGHLMGTLAGDQVPVVEGLPPAATDDQMKALGAAAASSGAVALFHAVGVTPEAPTRRAAFGGKKPGRVVDVRLKDLEKAWADLSTTDEQEAPIDAVVLGCPHFSFAEFRELARRIEAEGGAKVHPRVTFLVATGQASLALAERSPYLDAAKAFGARVTLDTCVFHSPILSRETRAIMTNSGKCSYYAPGELGVKVVFGSLADCVRSAVRGTACRSADPWNDA